MSDTVFVEGLTKAYNSEKGHSRFSRVCGRGKGSVRL